MSEIEVIKIKDSGISSEDLRSLSASDKAEGPSRNAAEGLNEVQAPNLKPSYLPNFGSFSTQTSRDSLSLQERQERRKRYCILNRYASSTFGPHLAQQGFDLRPESLEELSIDKLDTLTKEIHFEIGLLNNSNLIADGVQGIIQAMEIALKMPGFSNMVRSNKKFMAILEEISLENQDFAYRDAKIRLFIEAVKMFVLYKQSMKAADLALEMSEKKEREEKVKEHEEKIKSAST